MTDEPTLCSKIADAAGYIEQCVALKPTVGVILGSGLGDLAASVERATSIAYGDIPHFVSATVEGHKGALVIGSLGGHNVAVMNGRLHYYEGYTLQQVTFPIRVLKHLGCSTLIVTNAAGGLNPAFAVGDLMLIRDHINLPSLAGNNPLFGPNDSRLGPRFPDLHNAYDRDLRALARRVAEGLGLDLREGVYVMLGGPSFETPAEVRLLRAMGADAVGMSTAAEVIVARHGGMRVLGISMISNVLSTEAEAEPVDHREVLAAGAKTASHLTLLVSGVIQQL